MFAKSVIYKAQSCEIWVLVMVQLLNLLAILERLMRFIKAIMKLSQKSQIQRLRINYFLIKNQQNKDLLNNIFVRIREF